MGEKNDFTHSYIRGRSTACPPNRPKPPTTEPITTILKLEFAEGQGDACFTRSNGHESINEQDPCGQAVRTFTRAIEAQPGYKFWTWVRAEEEPVDVLYIFIGWERHPPTAFRSLASLQGVEPVSPLSALNAYMKSVPQLWNIPFNGPLHQIGSPSGQEKFILTGENKSIELISWTIPAHLDPTYHTSYAEQFEYLGFVFSRFDQIVGCYGPGDMLNCKRGWVAGCQDSFLPSKEEPSEKTHLFLLFWKGKEEERKHKDPDQRTFSPDMWREDDDFWERWFLDLQRDWETQGMTTSSLHLRFFHE